MFYKRLLMEKREEILAIASRHGADRIRYFGSTVRGEDDEKSDIDFVVVLEPGRSLFDHIDLIDDLKVLLGCEVDVVNERGIKPRIRDRILAEAIPL